MSGDPVDVISGGGAGSSHRAAWWACPGRPDVSAGSRTLAPSAADVLRRPVPVVGLGVVFALSGSVKRLGYCLLLFCLGPILAARKSARRPLLDLETSTISRYSPRRFTETGNGERNSSGVATTSTHQVVRRAHAARCWEKKNLFFRKKR